MKRYIKPSLKLIAQLNGRHIIKQSSHSGLSISSISPILPEIKKRAVLQQPVK